MKRSFAKKDNLTYQEIFALYNDRIIIDRNGMELFAKNGKFLFPSDSESLKNLKRKYFLESKRF